MIKKFWLIKWYWYKLPDYLNFKKNVILITCLIKDDGKWVNVIYKYFHKKHCKINKHNTKCISKMVELVFVRGSEKRNRSSFYW